MLTRHINRTVACEVTDNMNLLIPSPRDGGARRKQPFAAGMAWAVALAGFTFGFGGTNLFAQAVPQQTGTLQMGGGVTNAPAQAPRQGRRGGQGGPATLGLDQGFLDLDTPDFKFSLVKASQTVAGLKPKSAEDFDFTPSDQLKNRAGNNNYQLGDLTMRLRSGSNTEWVTYSTAASRKPVTALAASGDTLASADLTPTLSDDCPLKVTRSWVLEGGKLALQFEVENKSSEPVEIGSLGMPLIFNNYISGRTLPQAHAICSFSDPAICMDAGYVQVTRLSGHGPALVVVEDGHSPLEGYNPLLNERTRREQTFEGFYEWLVHTKAYAENEWKSTNPWNAPTSETLAPGAKRTFGLRFLLAPEIKKIEDTLAANNRPVAVGIPGYILPMDLEAKLFLNYDSKIKSVTVEPAGAISIKKESQTKNGWKAYTLQGKTWGRSRLTITYDDGLLQTISYDVTKPAAQAVADLGNFLFTKQWFVDPKDPFHRSPSVMTYDRGKNEIVTQESRAWFAGLEDEAGSGSWVAAAMKESGQPVKGEVDKFEQFVDGVLWGGIQYTNGTREYGVRKSMFYYDTNEFASYYSPDIRYGGWTAWNKREAESIGRAYNYPHVVAAYWSMYRLARNHVGLVTDHPWDWYLDHAYETIKFLTGRNDRGRWNVGYINTGLMEGDIFVMVVKDLKREGWNDKAAELEKAMKARADQWNQEEYPFGSEMAWDSTGQEEVYAWTKYFGYDEKGEVSLDSILGYMPTVPNWGYNGNARRYWDFLYGSGQGPTSRIERQIHHYGSGINAIPVLDSYREHPDDYYLLRVGYGGSMGALSSIDQDGFASAAFHAWPNTLRWDYLSGDYGPNFFGHALTTATYLIDHPEFGWQAFGGNVKVSGSTVKVQPLDSFRIRIYVAPAGLWLTLDSGKFDALEYNSKTHAVRVGLSPATEDTPKARLRISQPAKIADIRTYQPKAELETERDAFVIPLKSGTTWVELN